MPERLPEALIPVWQDIVERAPEGILAACDKWLVEMCCRDLIHLKNGTLCATEMAGLGMSLRKMYMLPDRRYNLIARYLPADWLDDLSIVSGGSSSQTIQ